MWKTILKTSCYDCHSNNTVYPWYSNIQPLAWWLQGHVNEGKEELNFDEFATYNPRRQFKKMEETEEMITEGEMPLSSYTIIHSNAVLSASQKETLINWAKSIGQEIKSKSPGSASSEEEEHKTNYTPQTLGLLRHAASDFKLFSVMYSDVTACFIRLS
jgi:hypothetical protein